MVRASCSRLDIYTSEWHMPNVRVAYLMIKLDNERDCVVPDLLSDRFCQISE